MNDIPICVECNEEIDVSEGWHANPDKPMHWNCYQKTPEGQKEEKRREELKASPYVEVTIPQEKERPKRYCWFHRNDLGEKVEAVCYWYTTDDGEYHVCEECAERYGGARKIHWYGERVGVGQQLQPFDPDCDHEMHKKNLVVLEDKHGMYDIHHCVKCGGERRHSGL